jgi:hypothetical protein
LLQANGIVWVEGPSDRLYFNQWIKEISDGALREGRHYQCVFYGGRLLARLSAGDPDATQDDAIQILRVNRNALVLIDSDRVMASSPVNATKSRIASEIESIGGLCWITAGREIENYLPKAATSALLGASVPRPVEPFEDFAAYLDGIQAQEGNRFLRNKVLSAEKMVPHLKRASFSDCLDLATRLEAAAAAIRKWNGL